MDFKKLLAEKASEWMQEKLTFLNHNRGKSFWQNYRTIFKPEESPIGPLKKANGALAITETEIAEELQQTFFEGRHLQEQVFDTEAKPCFANTCELMKKPNKQYHTKNQG